MGGDTQRESNMSHIIYQESSGKLPCGSVGVGLSVLYLTVMTDQVTITTSAYFLPQVFT